MNIQRQPIMSMEDVANRLLHNNTRLRKLLSAVLDAGRPHSHLCGCDQCAAFDAVQKELRGE